MALPGPGVCARLLLALVATQGWAAPAPAQPLAGRIDGIIQAARFDAAAWGIQVVSLDSGRTLYEHNGGKLFTPASNVKLFTAALAWQHPGPDFRIRTSLYGERAPDAGGVLHGDLILFGRGDPTILAPGTGWPDPLEALADQAWAAGLRAVDGDLLGDDSYFSMPPFGSGWECGDLGLPFGAEPTALGLHGNTVELRVYPGAAAGQPCGLLPMPGQGLVACLNRTSTGSGAGGIQVSRALGEDRILVTGSLAPGATPVQVTVPIHEPALLFAQLLRRALLRRGIRLGGRVRAVHYQARQTPLDTARLLELGHLESPPVRAILRTALKDSNNLQAQLMLLQAGAAELGPNTEGRSLAALEAFLRTAGIPPGEVLLEEGSGLSRKDLVTPRALVDLLAYLSRQPAAGAFQELLPLAGLDGTLAARMTGTPAQGNLRAKTGTMRYTYALSGYVTTRARERLAFSILLNNYHRDPKDPTAQEDIDAIAASLAESGVASEQTRKGAGLDK